VVLRRGGYRISLISPGLSRYGTWILVGLLTIGALMNFASSSNWERFLQAPVALLLALLCLMVARRAPEPGPAAASDLPSARTTPAPMHTEPSNSQPSH
jgi:hypothetical protein